LAFHFPARIVSEIGLSLAQRRGGTRGALAMQNFTIADAWKGMAARINDWRRSRVSSNHPLKAAGYPYGEVITGGIR